MKFDTILNSNHLLRECKYSLIEISKAEFIFSIFIYCHLFSFLALFVFVVIKGLSEAWCREQSWQNPTEIAWWSFQNFSDIFELEVFVFISTVCILMQHAATFCLCKQRRDFAEFYTHQLINVNIFSCRFSAWPLFGRILLFIAMLWSKKVISIFR